MAVVVDSARSARMHATSGKSMFTETLYVAQTIPYVIVFGISIMAAVRFVSKPNSRQCSPHRPRPQGAPRTAQDGPKRSQDAPEHLPRRSKSPHEALNNFLGFFKRHQRFPQDAPRPLRDLMLVRFWKQTQSELASKYWRFTLK